MIPARKEPVIDDYHGTKVPDPYRWMEDIASPETRSWFEAQNREARAHFDAIRAHGRISARLTELWDYPRHVTPVCPVPVRRKDRVFFMKNEGLQGQPVLYVQTGLDGEPAPLIDPNALSSDGTIALTRFSPSHDGRLLAYSLSQSGSDWQEIRIREVDTGRDYEEVLINVKFTGMAWKHDGTGFYYTRFPDPGSVSAEDQSCFARVCWHRVGTSQASDLLVHEQPDDKELRFDPLVSDDGEYLLLFASRGTAPRNRVYYRDLSSDAPFIHLLDREDALYDLIGNDGSVFYFLTDRNAPRRRIIAIDSARPQEECWREIVLERPDTLQAANMAADTFVCSYLHDASSILIVFDSGGKTLGEVSLPGKTSVVAVESRREDGQILIALNSFLEPPSVWLFELKSRHMAPWQRPRLTFDPERFETEQVFYPSKDGTRVPIFLTHRKDIRHDGNNPTILYGYGGFDSSMTPAFSPSVILWIESGGVFAHAGLRGGGEYGEEWHRAGMLQNKQNVFGDFIAAGEWLIAQGYTRPEKLAIMGRSNGGLLVAACMLQRPDLFGAVICNVPVTDMLRYHRFTVGRYWVPEYGNAEESAGQFCFLYAYSPLHNVKPGLKYPAVVVGTGESDDRVWPSHAFKFVATLQAAGESENPVLLRVETKAGHGLGKPTGKVIEEESDFYAFLFEQLGVS